MADQSSLGYWVRRFLQEYAASERNLSPNTCASYRDMLVLLLPFVAKRKRTSVDKLTVTDLSADAVRDFLKHLERDRKCGTATRNQRLASLRALARFIGAHSPEHVEWCAQIRMVPIKKGIDASITYLEKSEIDALLAAPDQSTNQGVWTSPGSVESHSLFLFAGSERCFERDRTDVAEARMPAARIIEAFDVFTNGLAGLVARCKRRAPDQLGLDRLEHGLDHSIVVTIAAPAHRRNEAVVAQHASVVV
jgi:integrase